MEIQKLNCTDSKVEALRKINAIADAIGQGMPIGTIFQAIRTDIPEGSLRLDGTEFTTGFEGFVTNYLATGKIISKSLDEWQTEYTMTNGNVGFFGYDEATGAFKTPCIQAGTFLAQAVASGEFGSFLNSELKSHTHTQAAHTHTRGTMNITGTFGTDGQTGSAVANGQVSGAFYNGTTTNWTIAANQSAKGTQIGFDASRSWTGSTSSAQPTINATGGSDTYPKHIRYPFFVVVSNVVAEEPSQVAWDNFVGNLDGKANKSDVVSKLGDTMTGILTGISSPHPFIARSNLMDITTTPTANQFIGYDFRDKNGTRIGWYGVVNNADGSKYFQMQNLGGVDGFVFPMCNTKATTTSTASGRKVATVIRNYVNGTSWYRVWSDGWIEQGGRVTSASITNVTFLKAFSNTNYTVAVSQNGSASGSVGRFAISSYQTNSFTIHGYLGDAMLPACWYACGY